MNLKTHYNIGSVVITQVDGAYQKGTVTGIRVYARKGSLEPTVVYEINVGQRFGSGGEAQLEANYLLYKKTASELSEEQSKATQAERDRLIFWNMRLDKPQEGKETKKDDDRRQTSKEGGGGKNDKPEPVAQTLPLYAATEPKSSG